jgi:hypothetical protein
MNETTTFIARTALGAPIETFQTRAQALAWIEARGDLFPGWTITEETEVRIIRSRVLRRDRSAERSAA